MYHREKIAAASARTSVGSRASSGKDEEKHEHPPSSKPEKGSSKGTTYAVD